LKLRAIALALSALALSPSGAKANTVSGRSSCVDLPLSDGSVTPLLDAVTMESSRAFTFDLTSVASGYDLAVLWVSLTDANSSITRFDTTCTVSRNSNTTDYTPQVCDDTSDGVCTQTSGNVFQKATPGSANWPIRLDVAGYPDLECTFAVGAGAGAAADLLTVYLRLCVD
jgi:hypothetical protein